jgi:hypothetical protein
VSSYADDSWAKARLRCNWGVLPQFSEGPYGKYRGSTKPSHASSPDSYGKYYAMPDRAEFETISSDTMHHKFGVKQWGARGADSVHEDLFGPSVHDSEFTDFGMLINAALGTSSTRSSSQWMGGTGFTDYGTSKWSKDELWKANGLLNSQSTEWTNDGYSDSWTTSEMLGGDGAANWNRWYQGNDQHGYSRKGNTGSLSSGYGGSGYQIYPEVPVLPNYCVAQYMYRWRERWEKRYVPWCRDYWSCSWFYNGLDYLYVGLSSAWGPYKVNCCERNHWTHNSGWYWGYPGSPGVTGRMGASYNAWAGVGEYIEDYVIRQGALGQGGGMDSQQLNNS